MCGEKRRAAFCFGYRGGSPPRVRGEVCPVATSERCPGITPRVRGEKLMPRRRRFLIIGSPPRARGEESVIPFRVAANGITPACAGRSRRFSDRGDSAKDHPRVCGEKSTGCATRLPCAGSPPRVRGEVVGRAVRTRTSGITPACAGRSARAQDCRARGRDHPPRVRGEVRPRADASLSRGITPACAGRSFIDSEHKTSFEDHSRVCGEKPGIGRQQCSEQGSPPRVRGEGEKRRKWQHVRRITPACAGRRHGTVLSNPI